jgi:hypothetical protein
VPVLPSGKDKVLYFEAIIIDWDYSIPGIISINGKVADGLRTTFGSNPFANHLNSKLETRYLATRVPQEWI